MRKMEVFTSSSKSVVVEIPTERELGFDGFSGAKRRILQRHIKRACRDFAGEAGNRANFVAKVKQFALSEYAANKKPSNQNQE